MREQLVDRAMRGDREAFTFLARDRADRCYAVAYRVLRTRTARRTPSSRRCSAHGATCRPSAIPIASTPGC